MPSLAFLFGAPIKAEIPAEFMSEATLLQYLAISNAELRKIWWFRHLMYKQFDIAKASGKARVISAPDSRLKMLQRKLASSLDKIYRPRHTVHGFVVGRSIRSNAISHLRSKFLMNLDIEQFFPSISERRVFGLLRALGISERVAEIIARICCVAGTLPQGAPTSPVISNMICFRMDKQLQAFAKEARCIYTRYADDITLSSYRPLNSLFEGAVPPAGNFLPEILTSSLQEIFRNNSFIINPKKAHYAEKFSRRTVTGLRVNELLNVDRKFVRNVRATLFMAEKQGIEAAQNALKDKYKRSSLLVSYLQGRVAWIGHIKGASDPVFRSTASRFNALFPEHRLNLIPTVAEVRDRAVWVVEHWIEGAHGLQGAQGTAFFLKGVGLVTAWHCVQDTAEVELFHPSKPSNKFKATVRMRDTHRDLAILKHDIPATEYYELDVSKRILQTGDNLTAAGYPGFGPGDKLNLRDGSISSLPTKSAVPMIEVTQKLVQGMSGGPLIGIDNAVAGVIHKGGPLEGRDFAVHVSALVEWLKRP